MSSDELYYSGEEEEEGPLVNDFARFAGKGAYNTASISPNNKISTIDIVMIEQRKSEEQAIDWIDENRQEHAKNNPNGFYAVWEMYQFPHRDYPEAVLNMSQMVDFLTF
jgi:hypothetical protein